jgi:hypothetical protein
MYHIHNFIEDNLIDWMEQIQKPPYNIIVRKGEYGFVDLVLLKYNQIKSDFSLPLVRECRGIILDLADNANVVCKAFDKFFNFGEKNAVSESDLVSPLIAQEKVDGSIMKLWYWERGKKWMVSTNGTIDASEAILPRRYHSDVIGGVYTFRDSFIDAIVQAGYKDLSEFVERIQAKKGLTYVFELTGIGNRVVVPYIQTELTYLTAFDNQSGREFFNLHRDLSLLRGLETIDIESINDVYSLLQKRNDIFHEGFVIVDSVGNRLKMKTEKYLEVHRLRGESVPSTARLLRLIVTGEWAQFVEYFPEYKSEIENLLKNFVYPYVMFMNDMLAKLWRFMETHDNRKEIALWIQENVERQEERHLLYQSIGSTPPNFLIDYIYEYLIDLNEDKLPKLLNCV